MKKLLVALVGTALVITSYAFLVTDTNRPANATESHPNVPAQPDPWEDDGEVVDNNTPPKTAPNPMNEPDPWEDDGDIVSH